MWGCGGGCVGSLFCNIILCVLSIIEIILQRERERERERERKREREKEREREREKELIAFL